MIYERQTDRVNRLYPVVTLEYLLEVIERSETKTIVLTGDAGHGKTSLCASVLGRLRTDEPGDASRAEIQRAVFADLEAYGDASRPVGSTGSGRPLYVLKDLSEINIDGGAQRLRALLSPPGHGVAIICANEGQLRKCVASDTTGQAHVIVQTLSEGIKRGRVTSPDGSVIVINLNYQTVASEVGGKGLVPWALGRWTTAQGNRWKVCENCLAQHVCPILANQRELSDVSAGPSRREAVKDLFAAAERTGAVITTRQALSVLSQMITGGLDCEDVHRRYSRAHNDQSWQYVHMYHQALFGDRLNQEQRKLVPTFRPLRRLDPGRVSRREVDDHVDPALILTKFTPEDPSSDEERVRTARDAQKQAERLRDLYVFLRRADFFNSTSTDRFARMGLQSGDDFVAVPMAAKDNSDTNVRDRFLKGLEAVQGVHRAGSNPDFVVLDPAFFTHRMRAAVISRRVSSKGAIVIDQVGQWRAESDTEPEMQHAVEWLNREIYIRIPEVAGDGRTVSVEADLMRFELLTRWAEGLRSEVQHEAEIRGLTGALAELAHAPGQEDEIQVLVVDVLRKLMIDVGDKIRLVRG
ncbi:hypothetical protein FFT09_12150 [Saccharomonospora piscinae]|uniref:hypothetical protein n=1 Tax=Saccharomonospora piscinae TaxID=687388 RepID=UPI0011060BBA|nr:hypothetical protein [Saccharomonospora piscinae]TLW91685.1 hypothetical protein FFT09_12150 [Saccharomonospora piscinae]